MAALLSADPSRRVLLVEAGPDYRASETPEAIRGANFIQVFRLGAHPWPHLPPRAPPGPGPPPPGAGGGDPPPVALGGRRRRRLRPQRAGGGPGRARRLR